MIYNESMIKGKVSKMIREATKRNMNKYHLGLYDAFKDAVQTYGKTVKLRHAWYYDDFREFIPSAYCEEYLDFSKYPLKYKL